MEKPQTLSDKSQFEPLYDGEVFLSKDVKKHLQEFKEEMKQKASDVNKTLDLHNVDECECCEKNWKCVYEILQIIDTQMQKHFGKELI